MSKTPQFDIIGDIHGYASELQDLLTHMGYEFRNKTYIHPKDRKVLFVGDYIDRGPEIRKVLKIVKGMTDNNQAIALMGNHEYNYICYHTIGTNGNFLRPHSTKNNKQHKATLEQFENYKSEWKVYLEWMKNLPLWIEMDALRAVHACWSEPIIKKLKERFDGNQMPANLWEESATEGEDLFEQIEITLKGKEILLPNGLTFDDKDGHPRKNVRVKWWIKPENITYKEIRVNTEYDIPNIKVDSNHPLLQDVYPNSAKPVFFGHYWLRGTPSIFRSNVCCLDYSVAKKGKLVSYRFNGEDNLSDDNLQWVPY